MSNPEEIWAARLQRELVALSSATNEDDSHSNPIGALPQFMQMKDYKLDIEHGFCQVSFVITIDGVKMPAVSTNENNESLGVIDPTLDQVQHGHGHATVSNLTLASSPTENEEIKDEKTSNIKIDHVKESEETRQYEKDNQNQLDAFHVQVLITLDASLKRNLADFHPSTSYPFQPPICIINSGAEYLPKDQHSIQNGEEVLLDCDWTPSLHLNDAALNVAVKIKESIKRGEPILEFTKKSAGSFTASLPNSLLDEVSQDFNKASHAISGFFSDLKTKASHIADELDQAVVGPSRDESVSTEEKSTRKGFKFRKGTKLRKDEEPLKVVTEENVEMGDSIYLSESPWDHALGMYPCKAIRRPTFMSTAMEASGHMDDQSTKVRNNDTTSLSDSDNDSYNYGDCAMPDNYLHLHAGGLREVTAAGLSGAGSIFRSFTKSAKSLVEESFLMLTNNLIMEITCNKFSVDAATVKFAIPASHLSKLKFKRGESVSLFFKQAPDDPIIYMCADSADAVKQIQNILKSHGVKGKHTNAAMQNVILEAVEMLDDIQVREHLLEKDPSKQMVTDIMDLYRQAAEKFELADDARHEQVVTMMKKFLAKPTVAGILDNTFVPATVPSATETENVDIASETQGNIDDASKDESYSVETSVTNSIKSEVSSSPVVDANDNHIDEGHLKAEEEELRKAMQDAESMIQSAHDDLAELTFDDIDDDDLNFNNNATLEQVAGNAESGDDVVSEFADMLADADKELSELIGSSS